MCTLALSVCFCCVGLQSTCSVELSSWDPWICFIGACVRWCSPTTVVPQQSHILFPVLGIPSWLLYFSLWGTTEGLRNSIHCFKAFAAGNPLGLKQHSNWPHCALPCESSIPGPLHQENLFSETPIVSQPHEQHFLLCTSLTRSRHEKWHRHFTTWCK